jgi:hypothetical protein
MGNLEEKVALVTAFGMAIKTKRYVFQVCGFEAP